MEEVPCLVVVLVAPCLGEVLLGQVDHAFHLGVLQDQVGHAFLDLVVHDLVVLRGVHVLVDHDHQGVHGHLVDPCHVVVHNWDQMGVFQMEGHEGVGLSFLVEVVPSFQVVPSYLEDQVVL